MKPLLPVITGPCVIESSDHCLDHATQIVKQLEGLPIDLTFKASFDKANRTSVSSFRGPGLDEGLEILAKVKQQTGLPLLTDFHEPLQADAVASVVDILQVPAFLCRQTDMIMAAVKAAAKHSCALNIKKGQFLAPWDCKNIVQKIQEGQKQYGNIEKGFFITERGVSFGYNYLVVDMSSFYEIHQLGAKVIYDATHSVQRPGGMGTATGGSRAHIEPLTRAAIAAGADGLFLESHLDPENSLSDAQTIYPIHKLRQLIEQAVQIRESIS